MFLTSKSLGKLWVGQGRTGSESTSEVDLSGTGLLSLNADEFLVAAGEDFQRNGFAVGRSIGQVQNNLDGHGRRDRIRYDTPKFAGFQITTSHENDDGWSTALRYGGSFGGVKVKAAIAYSDDSSRSGRETVNGSASILLPMGLSFTVAGGKQDDDRFNSVRDNAEMRYAKIGYKFKGLEMGQTRLFVSYGEFEDIGGLNEESQTFAFGVIQILEPLGIELQAGYANFSLEQPNVADPDDIDVVTIGARVKF
jgi:predicted porin